ncbi:MAG: kinase, partial [Steroidobacteraceae bacterium]
MSDAPASWIDPFLQREALPDGYRAVIREQIEPLGAEIIAAATARGDGGQGPLVVGICGAQGSGKSTLTAALSAQLGAAGLRVAGLSLDDLYLTRAERQRLSRTVHPLLATRGVPGTHDVALGTSTFARLGEGGAVALPSFDKGVDDRRPRDAWPRVSGPVHVILF